MSRASRKSAPDAGTDERYFELLLAIHISHPRLGLLRNRDGGGGGGAFGETAKGTAISFRLFLFRFSGAPRISRSRCD